MNINEDINDKAIQIVEKLVAAGIIKDCTDTDDQTEFEAQDIVADFLAEEQTTREAAKQVFLGEITTEFVPAENPREVAVRSSRDANDVLREIIGKDMQVRQMQVALYLNNANKIMAAEIITIGSMKSVTSDVSGISRQALTIGASGVIVGHNHPSGNKRPSEADRREAKKLKNALKTLDISLLDSIVLTDKEYYSFSDNGERSLA
jgi:DNA repair protein RadC